jgi:hypothetical protein
MLYFTTPLLTVVVPTWVVLTTVRSKTLKRLAKISSDRYEITCDPDTGLITLGVTALEHLWADEAFAFALCGTMAI